MAKKLAIALISTSTAGLAAAAFYVAAPVEGPFRIGTAAAAAATAWRASGWASDTPGVQAAITSPSQADESYYVTMRDGTQLAVGIYLPHNYDGARTVPTILVQTRYGRTTIALGVEDYELFRKAGFAVAAVDVRGTTASFGLRQLETGADEQADIEELVAHFASKRWSNGKIIAHGVSYMGNTADLATGRPAPALIGAIPQEVDFDIYRNVAMPGGIANDYLMEKWSKETLDMDEGRFPYPGNPADCRLRVPDCGGLYPFLVPVDGKQALQLAHQAVQRHDRWTAEDYRNVEFSDDRSRKGFSYFDSSPVSALKGAQQQAKPVQYWGSWMDAGTADAAITRYNSTPNVPAEVWITANSHLGRVGADPFLAKGQAPVPSKMEQFQTARSFAERLLRGERIQRRINYYVIGAGVFRQTATWPPVDAKKLQFALGPDHQLVQGNRGPGVDRYDVDFSATTGTNSRWTTNYGPDPIYGDRRAEDRKLIVYESQPMGEATEIVGTPVVTLHLASQTSDPAVFVYLEDVAPDGRVTYLTEGQLRAIHRKVAAPSEVPFASGPVPRTFKRADAQAVTPGEVIELRFSLFPTAALIKPGHKIRVAIAGADANIFRRYSQGRGEVFEIHRGGARRSMIELSTRPYRK